MKGTTKAKDGGEKEFEMEKDSGGTGSSGDDKKKKRDNLGLEEANGDNCVVIEDPREEEEIKGEDEEGREPKVMRAPKAVSKDQRLSLIHI